MKPLYALAAAAAAIIPTTASANNTVPAHMVLEQALNEAGVTTIVNSPECDRGTAGFYKSYTRELVVCQSNGYAYGLAAPWTESDLDTIRHEAHHVLQDCLGGGYLGDGDFQTLFTGQKFDDFVYGALSQRQIDWIVSTYAGQGADADEILLELEAWAAAASVSASTIAKSIDMVCDVPHFKF